MRRWALVMVVAAVGFCLARWGGAIWRGLVPMARPGWDNLPADVRATVEAQFRLAAIQATVAVGAAVALAYTVFNYRLTRRGQVTDRFTKALERLGSPDVYVRTGGVLALEQIVEDAPEQATHAAQILNSFLRDRAPRRAKPPPGRKGRASAARRAARRWISPPASAPVLPDVPHADVEAALTALTRPESRRHVDQAQRIDLSYLHLVRARLIQARLDKAELSRADLTGALLFEADLTNATLYGADLSGASFLQARLGRAMLGGTNLTGTDFTEARLCGATFGGANLTGADLFEADLTDADLSGADLSGANGLLPEQLLRARKFGPAHFLPEAMAADPEVAAQLARWHGELGPREPEQ